MYAFPMFIVALCVEGIVVRVRQGGASYAMRPLVGAIGTSVLDQLVNASCFVGFAWIYERVASHVAIVGLPASSPLTWIAAVLGHDVAYYAYHRASHRVNVLWAVHLVHHQSESYDFTVSTRQGTVATWVTLLFYLPLALLGVPLIVFVGVHAAYQIYQFFVHTRAVRRLWFFEAFVATPSHHRVHHGRDDVYIDKNYGGFFIVFDRLFGTFVEEKFEPDYGVPGGYEVVSPTFANGYYFARLVRATKSCHSIGEVAKLWLGPPEASTALMASSAHVPPAALSLPALARGYAVAQFVGALGGAIVLMFARTQFTMVQAVVATVLCIATIEGASAVLDGRRWARGFELLRAGAVIVCGVWLCGGGVMWAVVGYGVATGGVGAWALASAVN